MMREMESCIVDEQGCSKSPYIESIYDQCGNDEVPQMGRIAARTVIDMMFVLAMEGQWMDPEVIAKSKGTPKSVRG